MKILIEVEPGSIQATVNPDGTPIITMCRTDPKDLREVLSFVERNIKDRLKTWKRKK